jgi:organic hydroperoxide reductase OsmC/OhrA
MFRRSAALVKLRFDVTAHLIVPAGEDAARARHAVEKAERNCLISTSLKGSISLDVTVAVGEAMAVEVPAS